jgi:hypothetical protein
MALTADQALDWLIDVDVYEQAVSHVNWDSINANSILLLNASKQSSGAQNAEINFDVSLAAGTWTIEVMCLATTDGGIITFQLDGTTAGTVDTYRSSGQANTLLSVAGVTVASSGKKRLKLLMATKNASSSAYTCYLQHIQLRRTA